MALLEMFCYSHSLKKEVSFNVILPERRKNEEGTGAPPSPYKTLYLLHGLSDDHTCWLRRSSIERYAARYGIAVVMPNVDRSWYADTAYEACYFSFVAKELPEICRSYFSGMSHKREDTLVAGLSMGGYGALKIALSYPDAYGYCASLSGALDITRKNRPFNLNEWRGNFGFSIEGGDALEGGENDLFALTERLLAQKRTFPRIYLWCGTEDSLLPINRTYHETLVKNGIDHTYEESEGNHSWKWWDLHIQSALRCLLGEAED